jgi:hypothetical protein
MEEKQLQMKWEQQEELTDLTSQAEQTRDQLEDDIYYLKKKQLEQKEAADDQV